MLHGLGVTAESRRPMGRPQIPEANMPPQAAGGGVEDASPEEQALYNRVVALALLALYDEKMMPKTLKFIEQSSDPVEAVSEVASQIGMRVFAKAKEDGVDIPGDVLLHAGEEIVEEIIELVETAGLAEFTPEQAEKAFYATADKFSRAGSELGVYSDDQRQADKTELDRMADSGELKSILERIMADQQGGLG